MCVCVCSCVCVFLCKCVCVLKCVCVRALCMFVCFSLIFEKNVFSQTKKMPEGTTASTTATMHQSHYPPLPPRPLPRPLPPPSFLLLLSSLPMHMYTAPDYISLVAFIIVTPTTSTTSSFLRLKSKVSSTFSTRIHHAIDKEMR